MKSCRYPVVEVRWLDSAQLDGGSWIAPDRIEDAAEDCEQRTVGYLVLETEVALAVARSVSDWHSSAEKLEGVLTIPTVCVIERRQLRAAAT